MSGSILPLVRFQLMQAALRAAPQTLLLNYSNACSTSARTTGSDSRPEPERYQTWLLT